MSWLKSGCCVAKAMPVAGGNIIADLGNQITCVFMVRVRLILLRSPPRAKYSPITIIKIMIIIQLVQTIAKPSALWSLH